jgi:pyrroline-5-carboxylate reductase
MASPQLARGHRFGFIGGGNLAEALVRGLLAAGAAEPDAVRASDPSDARRQHLEREYGITTAAGNAAVADFADVIVICTKPGMVAPALRSVRDQVMGGDLVVSVAAGISTRAIEAELPAGTRVVRAMPNTAAMAGAAATALSAGATAGPDELRLAEAIFAAVGTTVIVPEAQLDAVTGLSGSGPAFVMLVIEALADGGVRAGLPREVALALAAQTVLGAAKLQIDTGEHPAVLKDRVTSPGGTTIAGLSRLEQAGVRGAFIDAVHAAALRARELGS